MEDDDVVHLQNGAYWLFNASEAREVGSVPQAQRRALQVLEMEVTQIMKVGAVVRMGCVCVCVCVGGGGG